MCPCINLSVGLTFTTSPSGRVSSLTSKKSLSIFKNISIVSPTVLKKIYHLSGDKSRSYHQNGEDDAYHICDIVRLNNKTDHIYIHMENLMPLRGHLFMSFVSEISGYKHLTPIISDNKISFL